MTAPVVVEATEAGRRDADFARRTASWKQAAHALIAAEPCS
jgi:hypothetical protein